MSRAGGYQPDPRSPLPPPPAVHQHTFTFCGVVYSFNAYSNLGGSARTRYLEDKMFCNACLETRYINRRSDGDNYSPLIPGTVPK